MQTKLTLRLDDRLVARAKAHARRTGRSVSRIVADYFSMLNDESADQISFPPLVAKLKGSLSGSGLDEEDYHDHLAEKYL